MRYLKVFVSSTKAHELMSILNGVTRFMQIPVRLWDTGPGMEGSGKMWIKFEVCDGGCYKMSWDDLKDRVDELNRHGIYAGLKSGYAMPCEIEVYDTEAECFEPGSPDSLC